MKARCTPFSVASRRPSAAPAGARAPRSARRRSRSACAARRCSGRRSPSAGRCSGSRRISCVRMRARASPFTSIAEQLPHLVHVVARLPLRSGAARGCRSAPSSGSASCAVTPRRSLCWRTMPKSPSFRLRPSHTKTFIGVRSRCSIWPRCSLPSTCEDAGDLAPRDALGPALAGAAQERAAGRRAARTRARGSRARRAVRAHQREGVEDADRARMAVEQLPEVRLAQPAVDARADLDADASRGPPSSGRAAGRGTPGRSRPRRAVGSMRYCEPRLRAGDDLLGGEQLPRPDRCHPPRSRAGRRRRDCGLHPHTLAKRVRAAQRWRRARPVGCYGSPPDKS